MANVTVLEFDVAGLLLASSIVTAGCVLQATPLAPPPGCVVNTTLVAVPAVMLKLLALLGAVCDGLLEAVSVYPVPLLVMAQPLKLATPLDTVTGPVPPALLQLSTPLPGLVLMVRVTVVALSPVSTLELVSAAD